LSIGIISLFPPLDFFYTTRAFYQFLGEKGVVFAVESGSFSVLYVHELSKAFKLSI